MDLCEELEALGIAADARLAVWDVLCWWLVSAFLSHFGPSLSLFRLLRITPSLFFTSSLPSEPLTLIS
jgi:hypothetical protein